MSKLVKITYALNIRNISEIQQKDWDIDNIGIYYYIIINFRGGTMLKVRNVKRVITILLIISLIYANVNTAILGLISYALDERKETQEAKTNNETQKELEIQVSDFCKNNMQEQETEYEEKLKLNLQYEESFNEVLISDLSAVIAKKETEEISSEEIEENNIEEQAKVFYKTTKINKTELMNVIGDNGSLEIKYSKLEKNEVVENNIESSIENQEGQNEGKIVLPEIEENTIVLPQIEEQDLKEGQIIAEDGTVVISKATAADGNDCITIIYPENTYSIEIKVLVETNKIENLNIVNNKVIGKVENLDETDRLEIVKSIAVKGEKELLNTQEIVNKPIEYTKTVAELGIDKAQISTAVENKLNFTITMHTDKIIYDLYKNPYFVIELPSTVKTVKLDALTILNNKDFTINGIEEGTLENGNKAIAIKLEGEQTEYTKSVEENTQIVFETTITTNDLIPTTEGIITLHYQNESAKTYDGIGIQENGSVTALLTFVSNKEVIVETKAIIGEQIISSPRANYNTVVIEPHTYQSVGIIGMAINNTGINIQNAKILGTATNVGPISGVETVYYTQNENATIDLTNPENGWSAEYVQNAKKYLIYVGNFEQAQGINFGYYMNLPKNIEMDVAHEATFEVYDDNNQVIATSKTIIYQEAERFDTYQDEAIKAEMIFENGAKKEVGRILEGKINITNISERAINNVELYIDLPNNLEHTYTNINVNNTLTSVKNNKIQIKNINVEAGATVTVELYGKIKSYVNPSETITSNINYEGKQIEIFNKIGIAQPAQIETTITSNKLAKTLEANENIEYVVTLKNTGKSETKVDFTTPQLENMYVQRIETINTTTGESNSVTSGDLTNGIADISIAPNETVQVKISCTAKSLERDTIVTMYAEVTGDTIDNVTTDKISNTISREIAEEQVDNTVQAQSNSITGVAWIDKNENGQKDENETLLKGIQAVLIDTRTLKEVDKQTTNNKGEYNFNNVEEGSYIVEFKYNTNTLDVTKYKNEKAPENLDSDVINTTQNNTTTAKTEVMELTRGETKNVNAGFVINKKFDMSINKGITKVTVSNEQGTNTHPFNSSSMAKVEIDGEYLKGSTILVEYEIAVTNSGEVNGYAKLISDEIPEGMKFNSELNTDWYEGDDGKLYSVALANKELKPGETAIVKLVLTKEMTDDKVLSPINRVSLEETFNEYLIEDKNKDNNSSEATIIISLTTGHEETYIWLLIVVIAIIGLGTVVVIKINNRSSKERRN